MGDVQVRHGPVQIRVKPLLDIAPAKIRHHVIVTDALLTCSPIAVDALGPREDEAHDGARLELVCVDQQNSGASALVADHGPGGAAQDGWATGRCHPHDREPRLFAANSSRFSYDYYA